MVTRNGSKDTLKWKSIKSWKPLRGLKNLKTLYQKHQKQVPEEIERQPMEVSERNDFVREWLNNDYVIIPPSQISPFNRRFIPRKILSVSKENQQTFFCIDWQNIPGYSFLPAEVAHQECPNLVIDFFEETHEAFGCFVDDELCDFKSLMKFTRKSPRSKLKETNENLQYDGTAVGLKVREWLETSNLSSLPPRTKVNVEISPFQRRLSPRKILGLLKQNEQTFYRISFEDTKEVFMILASEARLECPRLVIEFFEENHEAFRDGLS